MSIDNLGGMNLINNITAEFSHQTEQAHFPADNLVRKATETYKMRASLDTDDDKIVLTTSMGDENTKNYSWPLSFDDYSGPLDIFSQMCTIEPERVITFDQLEYDHNIEDCEYVVLAEKSSTSDFIITTKKDEDHQYLSIFIGGQTFEVLFPHVNSTQKNSKFYRFGAYIHHRNGEYEDRHFKVIKEDNGVYLLKFKQDRIEIKFDGSKLQVHMIIKSF